MKIGQKIFSDTFMSSLLFLAPFLVTRRKHVKVLERAERKRPIRVKMECNFSFYFCDIFFALTFALCLFHFLVNLYIL
jgi:hypothetical protein